MKKDQRIIAIIQARMGSSRLPGKVLMEIDGKPMLQWAVDRTRQSQKVDDVVVATTTDPSDDAIQEFCDQTRINVYRGDQFDVMDRFTQTAKAFKADVIVRITADCPLIDPEVIDKTIEAFLENNVRFAANRLPPPWERTYPIGLDTEVCSFEALAVAWSETSVPFHREHVMPYFYDTEEKRKEICIVNAEQNHGKLRFTVDTKEDLDLVQQIVALLPNKEHFTWLDVVAVLEKYPELKKINANVQAKKTYEVDKRAK